MKAFSGFLSLGCALGLAALPALGQTMALVPVGEDPDNAPFTIAAMGNDAIEMDVFVRDSGVAVQSFQSTMPCTVSGGASGSIDYTSKVLDEARADYIFFGLNTFSPGGAPANCPDLPDGRGSPSLGSLVLQASHPVVTDWKYLGTWTYTVSGDAEGTFSLDLRFWSCPPVASCTAPLTNIGDTTPNCIPLAAVHGLTIVIQTGQCCDGMTCLGDYTLWDCLNNQGGTTWNPNESCPADSCACAADADCNDGDPCTEDTCAPEPGECANTYRRRPYGDIQPVPDPPATHPCDAEERARMGDGFLTMLDVMCAFNAMNDGAPFTNCPCADVQPCGGDNFLTMLDVMAIFNTMNEPASAPCPDPCP